MAKKTKGAKKAAKVARKAAKVAKKAAKKQKNPRRRLIDAHNQGALICQIPRTLILTVLFERPRNRPVKCRMPPKTSMAKPSIAPPGPPVPLRGHCGIPSKSSPIRL
jgi:hypothetical protein